MGFSEWFKAIMVLDLTHISGLPLPENSRCRLTLYADKLQFKDASTTIELEKGRITDVELRKFTRQESQIESSFLKTVAGAALFGFAGAIIGAMPEERKKNVNHAYLVIRYRKNENDSFIVLDATDSINWSECLIKSLGFSKKENKILL